MSSIPTSPPQTHEQMAVTSTDVAGWSANFVNGVVKASEHQRKTSTLTHFATRNRPW